MFHICNDKRLRRLASVFALIKFRSLRANHSTNLPTSKSKVEQWPHAHISIILTDRHTDMQTCRHADIQTYRHTYMQTYRHTDIQTYRHTDMQTYRHADAKFLGLYEDKIHIQVNVYIFCTYLKHYWILSKQTIRFYKYR